MLFQTSQLMVFGVSLEMQSDSKSYVSVQDDEITELVHTIKSQWSLSDYLHGLESGLNARLSKLFTEFPQKARDGHFAY